MNPRIVIACSGLGHVWRGNETWAGRLAEELHRSGTDITLLGGGPASEFDCPYERLANWRREHWLTRSWMSWHHRYLVEQHTFELALRRRLRRQPAEIIHVADPALAFRLHRKAVELRTRVIYKDGLSLGTAWCAKFDHVQVLAPEYLERGKTDGADTRGWFVIPHFVDTRLFHPAADRAEVRRRVFGGALPPDAFVVLAVGDFAPGSNKRLDWVAGELGKMPGQANVHLILAGHSNPGDYSRFEQMTHRMKGLRAHLLTGLTPRRMPEVYQAADVFAHGALREPFGIVFLEAMASGLPLAGHTYPVTQWIIGEAGVTVDMTTPGALSTALAFWQSNATARDEIRQRARRRAELEFAPARIVPLYLKAYRSILGY
jgi:1,2-diacylglycerol 3-alpha-glucosyltransferase